MTVAPIDHDVHALTPNPSPKRRGELKRRLVTICVCLLLGAIVNVAVAWGISAFAGAVALDTGHFSRLSIDDARAYWSRHAPSDWIDASMIEGTSVMSWAPGRADLVVVGCNMPASASADSTYQAIGNFDAGWPTLALRSFNQVSGKTGATQTDVTWGWQTHIQTFPLLPIWPGFAINTAFYAAVLWLLLIGPGRLRRVLRLRRGLCPACAYPIGASDVCTECGKPVVKRGVRKS